MCLHLVYNIILLCRSVCLSPESWNRFDVMSILAYLNILWDFWGEILSKLKSLLRMCWYHPCHCQHLDSLNKLQWSTIKFPSVIAYTVFVQLSALSLWTPPMTFFRVLACFHFILLVNEIYYAYIMNKNRTITTCINLVMLHFYYLHNECPKFPWQCSYTITDKPNTCNFSLF